MEKISIGRLAFESNVHQAEAFFVLLLLLLSTCLYKLRWTASRAVFLLLAFFIGYVIWESYVGYVTLDPESVRWLNIPIKTVTATAYSEICREWVVPLLTWRFASAFLGAAAFLAVLEAVWYFRQRQKNSVGPAEG